MAVEKTSRVMINLDDDKVEYAQINHALSMKREKTPPSHEEPIPAAADPQNTSIGK